MLFYLYGRGGEGGGVNFILLQRNVFHILRIFSKLQVAKINKINYIISEHICYNTVFLYHLSLVDMNFYQG